MDKRSDDILVSVCIPSYNTEKYIRQTVESALNQTHRNVEVIVVDDASKDGTLKVLHDIHDDRLRVYQNERNLGAPGNWYKTIMMAQGEYTKIVCGDDVLEPLCIERQLNAFLEQANNRVALVASRRAFVNGENELLNAPNFQMRAGMYTALEALKKSVRTGTNVIGEPMAVLFRTSSFKKHVSSISSNLYMMDLELYRDILKDGGMIMLPTVDSMFRVHQQALASRLAWKQITSFTSCIVGLRKSFSGINIIDVAMGSAMATMLAVGRWFFYVVMNTFRNTSASRNGGSQ